MPSGALAQIMIAEALRACIRGADLYCEVRGDRSGWRGPSLDLGGSESVGDRAAAPRAGLVRQLVSANAVRGIDRELVRIRACGDLAAPICTYPEAMARERRLQLLGRTLPAARSLLETAQEMIGLLPVGVLADPNGQLLLPVRGRLVAMDEAQIRACEERVERSDIGSTPVSVGSGLMVSAQTQSQQCVELLHSEASAWRIVDTSDLANRLLADRGLLDTYSQARKRARGVLRAHTEADGDILRPAELADLLRWHASVVVQLELLGAGFEAEHSDLAQLQTQARELEGLLQGTLDILGLWKVLGGAAGAKRRKSATLEWPQLVESLTDFLRSRSTACLAALPRVYGLSKSNFRALVGSQTL